MIGNLTRQEYSRAYARKVLHLGDRDKAAVAGRAAYKRARLDGLSTHECRLAFNQARSAVSFRTARTNPAWEDLSVESFRDELYYDSASI